MVPEGQSPSYQEGHGGRRKWTDIQARRRGIGRGEGLEDTSASRAPPSDGFVTSLNNDTNWVSNGKTHELLGDISHLNPRFLRIYTSE